MGVAGRGRKPTLSWGTPCSGGSSPSLCSTKRARHEAPWPWAQRGFTAESYLGLVPSLATAWSQLCARSATGLHGSGDSAQITPWGPGKWREQGLWSKGALLAVSEATRGCCARGNSFPLGPSNPGLRCGPPMGSHRISLIRSGTKGVSSVDSAGQGGVVPHITHRKFGFLDQPGFGG